MSTTDPTNVPGETPVRRMTPDQVRGASFNRTSVGRRGFAEEEVESFAHRVADELAGREADNMRLFDENRRLKQAMRDWQSRQPVQTDATVQQRVTADAAALMARAQQHIDAQVAQAELYCRQREMEAVQRYDEIVRQARAQAAAEAERVAHEYRAVAGPSYSSDKERIQRQHVYLRAMLKALDAVGDHLQATRVAFAAEVTNFDEWATGSAEPTTSELEAPESPPSLTEGS